MWACARNVDELLGTHVIVALRLGSSQWKFICPHARQRAGPGRDLEKDQTVVRRVCQAPVSGWLAKMPHWLGESV